MFSDKKTVVLTDREWEQVLYCVDCLDFDPRDRRAASLVAKISKQTGLTKLPDKRYSRPDCEAA